MSQCVDLCSVFYKIQISEALLRGSLSLPHFLPSSLPSWEEIVTLSISHSELPSSCWPPVFWPCGTVCSPQGSHNLHEILCWDFSGPHFSVKSTQIVWSLSHYCHFLHNTFLLSDGVTFYPWSSVLPYKSSVPGDGALCISGVRTVLARLAHSK